MNPQILFTTQQAPGALSNGTLVEKCNSEIADVHKDGETGKIVGSIGPIHFDAFPNEHYGYWVVWGSEQGAAFVRESKIKVRQPS